MKRIILSSLLILESFTLYAGEYTVYPMSDLQVGMLPLFCQVWHSGDGAATDVWVEKLKMPNIHHFCKGLNHVNMATISVGKSTIIFEATTGVKEFEGILNHSSARGYFPLRPFIFLNMAKLYSLKNDKNKAVASYKAAIKENPQYTQAYVELIDLFIKYKDKESAREVLEQGLINNPNSKLLLKRKKNLGF